MSIALVAMLACQPASTSGQDSGPSAGDGGHSAGDGGSEATPAEDDTGTSGDGGTPTAPAEGDCDLASDLSAAHVWEGDTVSFTVGCTGSLATEDAEISAVGLPAGARFDTATLTLRWTTGPTDGGRHELSFSSRPAGAESTIPAASQVTVWVADNPHIRDAVGVDPAEYSEEWGLPVMHVETTAPLSESEHPATITWLGETYPSLIKIRGASSAGYAKPGYTLDFDEDELALPAWDDTTRDHLVLLSPFDDNSYVRQKLVYDQWAAIADYWGADRLTPRTFFVVVYIDGGYHGLYIGLDRIDDEFVRHMGFYDDGNLYKAVSHDANYFLTASGGGAKSTLHDGFEKKEGLPEGDFSDLDELVGFTGSSGYDQLVDQADDWIDLEEFMDWFLLVHFSLAGDSAAKNAYLYHDPVLDRFYYAPWDFNHSWGQNWYTARTRATDLEYFTAYNRVFAAIQGVPETDDILWERFTSMRADGPFALSWMEDQLDGYFAQIDSSAQRDWDRWGDDYNTGWWQHYRSGDWTDYEGEKAYVRTWISARHDLFERLHP